MNRRDLIKNLIQCGAMASFSSAFEVIAKEVVHSTLDNKKSALLNNYIQFNLFGAPARWMYDNPLKPYGGSIISNPFVMTSLYSNDIDKGDSAGFYRDINLHGVRFPYLWSQKPLTRGGETFESLANNFASIRGVYVGIDGHAPASRLFLQDEVGNIPNYFYKEAEGLERFKGCYIGQNQIINRGYFSKINNSIYLEHSTDFKENAYDVLRESKIILPDVDLENAVEKNLSIINNSSEKKTSLVKKLKKVRETFLSDYTEIYFKYRDIFLKARGKVVEGKLDRSIFPESLSGIPLNSSKYHKENNRYGSRFHFFTEKSDMIKGFENVEMDEWIHLFSIAEFLIVNNLSSRVILAPNGKGDYFTNYNFSKMISKVGLTRKVSSNNNIVLNPQELVDFQSSIRFDAHNIGSVFHHLTSNLFFYVFHSCLNELVSTLRDKKLFDQTLIHVSSEYDRKPKNFEAGSGHNRQGQNHSFYSGLIKSPFVVGNTMLGEPKEKERTFGSCNTGAISPDLKRYIKPSDIHKTLRSLLIDSDTSMSLFARENGKIVNGIRKSSIV